MTLILGGNKYIISDKFIKRAKTKVDYFYIIGNFALHGYCSKYNIMILRPQAVQNLH